MKGLINMGSALAFTAFGMVMLEDFEFATLIPLYVVVLAAHAAGAAIESVMSSEAVRKD